MVAITAEPILDPPCPRVGVTVTGLAAGDQVVSVWRTADGERDPVRGARTVTAVDSFYMEDYEAPLGRLVAYELEVVSGPDAGVVGVGVDVRLDATSGFIHDPMNPASAVPVHGVKASDGEAYFRSSAFSTISYTAGASVFQILGSRKPVSITGPRQAPSGVPLSMSTRSDQETERLRSLVSEAVHLVIRPLPEWGQRIPGTATYLAATVDEQFMDSGELTRWETTGDVVRGSAVRVVTPLWSYQDVGDIFGTYDQKQAAAGGGTYLDDQKNPANV